MKLCSNCTSLRRTAITQLAFECDLHVAVLLAPLRAGFEPWSPAWEAGTLTRPRPLALVARAPLEIRGVRFYMHSTYPLASATLTPLNLIPIQVTAPMLRSYSVAFLLAPLQTGFKPRSPEWEVGALTRRLKATASVGESYF